VPDASAQGVAGYIAAHNGAPASLVQSVPDASAQGVAGYIAAHNGSPASGQSVPDAAVQSVLSYLRAHGIVLTDPNDQAIRAYLNAGGDAAIP